MKIEALSVAHSEIVAAIHLNAFDEHWTVSAFMDLISMPASFGYLSVLEDEPVGFILCQGDDVEAEIITIATRQDFQRRGIADKLLETALQKSERMFLEVAEDNEAARNFYVKSGFIEIGRRKNYYKRVGDLFVDALVMELKKA